MEALSRFRKCFFVYERNLLRLVGHDIFVENFKPGLHAHLLYGLLVSFIFSNLYTIYAYDSFMLLNALMFLFIAIEVSVFVGFVAHPQKLKTKLISLHVRLCR